MAAKKELVDEAERLFRSGDHAKAYVAFLKLAKSHPEEDGFRVRLGEACVALGRREDALRIYKHLAANLIERGKMPAAVSICKRSLEIDGKDLEIQNMLQKLYAQAPQENPAEQNQWERARNAAKKRVQQIAQQDLIQGGGDGGLELAGPNDKVTLSITEMVGSDDSVPMIRRGTDGKLDLDDSYRGADRSISGADGFRNVSFGGKEDMEDLSLASSKETPTAYPQIALFSDLPPAAFANVINHFRRAAHGPEAVVLKQGDKGDAFYIVASGNLRVEREVKGRRVNVAQLGPGDFFGEFAFFAKSGRVASVIAESPVELLELTRKSVEEIIREHPNVEKAMHNLYKSRVLHNLLRESSLFSSLTENDREALMKHFEFREVKKGEAIVREGEPPDGFFVIQRGSAAVSKGKRAAPHSFLKAGEFFGEYSMITGSPRTATISAAEDCTLGVLDAAGFRALLAGKPKIVEELRRVAKARLAAATPKETLS